MSHVPVMLGEVLQQLGPRAGATRPPFSTPRRARFGRSTATPTPSCAARRSRRAIPDGCI
jgi:hypothetical protein